MCLKRYSTIMLKYTLWENISLYISPVRSPAQSSQGCISSIKQMVILTNDVYIPNKNENFDQRVPINYCFQRDFDLSLYSYKIEFLFPAVTSVYNLFVLFCLFCIFISLGLLFLCLLSCLLPSPLLLQKMFSNGILGWKLCYILYCINVLPFHDECSKFIENISLQWLFEEIHYH